MPGDLTAVEARLRRVADDVLDGLRAAGRLRAGATAPRLALPGPYAGLLAWALERERGEGGPEGLARAEVLEGTYGEWVPRLRVEQLATSEPTAEWLFHTPIDWARTPRLRAALGRLYALYAQCGVRAPEALGAGTLEGLLARRVTLGELFERTYFGGLMPMLYTWPGDLEAIAGELAAGADPWAVFDRRVAAALVHELSHFDRGRDALLPPYADECVAGWVGVHAWPALCWPEAGDDGALFGAPWFAQVGQALARVVGVRALVRAHAGADRWDEVLPPGLREAMERLGRALYLRHREPHFLSGNTRPDPWLKLFFLAGGGVDVSGLGLEALEAWPWAEVPAGARAAMDHAMFADAVRSMALRPRRVGGTYRVTLAAPETPVTVDPLACRIWRPAEPDSPEPADPSYLLPPALAARLRERGVTRLRLRVAAAAAHV